ncbi:MAG: hypothetical protein VCD00_09925 [Candidatus Hydrogenedentota bacterium]
MPDSMPDHHLDAASNVQFALGVHNVHLIDVSHSIESLIDSSEESTLIVGLRLSPKKELLDRLARRIGLQKRESGTFHDISDRVVAKGWSLEDGVAVLPTLDSARFSFPLDDAASHRFLIREILLPRRYSLPLKLQLLLRVYALLLALRPGIRFLYRGVYIRIRRS